MRDRQDHQAGKDSFIHLPLEEEEAPLFGFDITSGKFGFRLSPNPRSRVGINTATGRIGVFISTMGYFSLLIAVVSTIAAIILLYIMMHLLIMAGMGYWLWASNIAASTVGSLSSFLLTSFVLSTLVGSAGWLVYRRAKSTQSRIILLLLPVVVFVILHLLPLQTPLLGNFRTFCGVEVSYGVQLWTYGPFAGAQCKSMVASRRYLHSDNGVLDIISDALGGIVLPKHSDYSYSVCEMTVGVYSYKVIAQSGIFIEDLRNAYCKNSFVSTE